MKKLVITLALAALPAMAFAQGVDITWDDCIGGSTNTSKVFNCAANANYNLHFQFKLPAPIPNFVSLTGFVDYQNASGTPLSPFWRYEGGGCQIAPAVDGIAMFDDNGVASSGLAAACATVGNGGTLECPFGDDGTAGTEGIVGYGVDFRRPGNGYFIMLDYRSDAVPLVAGGQNYWAWRVNFRTINRAACPGCADPGIILWQRASLESNDGSPAVNLDNTDKMTNCVSCNNGSPALCPVVPARSTTWGQVKSLYR